MSDLIRFSLAGDHHAALRRVLPGISAAQLDALDRLVLADLIATDDGQPHPRLLAWVQAVLGRGDDEAVAVSAPGPVGPATAGAMIGGMAC